MTIIAIADFAYQRNRWWAKHRMTLQEVRDEFKQMEGDPKIEAASATSACSAPAKRMMAQCAKGDGRSSPTRRTMRWRSNTTARCRRRSASPRALDAVALRIRAKAEEHDIPIVVNPPLARALYASVDVDKSIPAEQFKAVAQVIGYVMRLRDKRRWRPTVAGR